MLKCCKPRGVLTSALWHLALLWVCLAACPASGLSIASNSSRNAGAHSISASYPPLFGQAQDVPLLGSKTDGTDIIAPINMELAITEPEHHQGLMNRPSMEENAGMIFIYPDAQRRVLYMRNTEIPLDAGWFTASGELTEVMHLKPMDETWRWSQRSDIKFGLEMNDGWFAKHGLEPSKSRIDMTALKTAVLSRGFDLTGLGMGEEKQDGPVDSAA